MYREKDYATIKKTILQDNHISLEAKGFLALVLNIQETFQSKELLQADEFWDSIKDGMSDITRIFIELKYYGYIKNHVEGCGKDEKMIVEICDDVNYEKEG